MNAQIKQLADQALKECDAAGERDLAQYTARFAALIVKACADATDEAYDARCDYPGDYVGEQMGFGEEDGITAWRSGQNS
jgi:hypothetical protein